MMIVVTIIGILGSLTFYGVGYKTRANDNTRELDMRNIVLALESYNRETYSMPEPDTTSQGKTVDCSTEYPCFTDKTLELMNQEIPTLTTVPKDPNGNWYGYRPINTDNTNTDTNNTLNNSNNPSNPLRTLLLGSDPNNQNPDPSNPNPTNPNTPFFTQEDLSNLPADTVCLLSAYFGDKDTISYKNKKDRVFYCRGMVYGSRKGGGSSSGGVPSGSGPSESGGVPDSGGTTPPTEPAPIFGECGAGSRLATPLKKFSVAPTKMSDLCAKGNPSAVTEHADKYTWSCIGENGGSSAVCEGEKRGFKTKWNTSTDLYSRILFSIIYTGSGHIIKPNGQVENLSYSASPRSVSFNFGRLNGTVNITGVNVEKFQIGGIGREKNSFYGVEDWGGMQWKNMEGMFKDINVAFSLPREEPDLSQVESMREMFACQGQSGYDTCAFNDPNITYWDVSQVKDMSRMFACERGTWTYGTCLFNQDISNWNVEKVENMSEMFLCGHYSYCNFDQPIGAWKPINVTTMEKMFAGGYFSYAQFNKDLSGWGPHLGKVENMSRMFGGTHSTEESGPHGGWRLGYHGTFSGWNVSNVTDMSFMFARYQFNTSMPPIGIGSWNTSKVENMSHMFAGSSGLRENISQWDLTHVDNIEGIFRLVCYNTAYNIVGAGQWDLTHIQRKSNMFANFWGNTSIPSCP